MLEDLGVNVDPQIIYSKLPVVSVMYVEWGVLFT
jgi:hypothetical protein